MHDIPSEPSCTNEETTVGYKPVSYLRGVNSSMCLLLPRMSCSTSLEFRHPLSEEMNEDQFLDITGDSNITNMQNSGEYEVFILFKTYLNNFFQEPIYNCHI